MFLNRDLIDVFVVLTRVVKEFVPPPSLLMKDLPVVEVVDVQSVKVRAESSKGRFAECHRVTSCGIWGLCPCTHGASFST